MYIKSHITICIRKKNLSLYILKKNQIRELKIPTYFSQDNHFSKRQYFNFGLDQSKVDNTKLQFIKFKIVNSF